MVRVHSGLPFLSISYRLRLALPVCPWTRNGHTTEPPGYPGHAKTEHPPPGSEPSARSIRACVYTSTVVGHLGVPHQSRRLPYVRSDDGGYRWGTRNHFDMQNDLNILLLPSRG